MISKDKQLWLSSGQENVIWQFPVSGSTTLAQLGVDQWVLVWVGRPCFSSVPLALAVRQVFVLSKIKHCHRWGSLFFIKGSFSLVRDRWTHNRKRRGWDQGVGALLWWGEV